MLRNYADALNPKSLVAASVLAATSAGTTGVDMGTSRHAMLEINLTVGSDVATDFVVQHCDTLAGTYADLLEVTDAELAATALVVKNLPRIKRYLRVKWTRGASGADSYWAINAIGFKMRQAPA